MLRVNNDHLVVSFPDVHDRAALRLDFRTIGQPDQSIALGSGPEGGFVLGTSGRVVLHLRPDSGGFVYPFAVVLTVSGTNALTGLAGSARLVRPQNYVVTPPQGGVDGYLAGSQVHPFVACGDPADDRVPLDIRVIPMKPEAFRFASREGLFGWSSGWVSEFTLRFGGQRDCEPLYEDLCCLGDWDEGRGEQFTVWLHRRS